jgi:hypothetical protein
MAENWIIYFVYLLLGVMSPVLHVELLELLSWLATVVV